MFHDIRKRIHYSKSFLQKKLVHLNLQILYDCNFRCKICDFWKPEFRDLPHLTISQAEIIAEKLKLIGPLIISMGGGEPLLHKDLILISRILAKNNFLIMITNGWYMTSEIASEIWDAGFYEVSVSVDFASPEEHDKMRGMKDAHARALSALKILHENRKYPHQRVHMISTVMEKNLVDIEPLINTCKKNGYTFLVSCYCRDRGNIKKNDGDLDFSAHLLQMKRRYRHFVSVRGYLSGFTQSLNQSNGIRPCYAGKNLFNINCQGDVTLCIDRLDNPAGNILKDDIFEIQQKLLEQHKKNDCGNCWTSCRGPVETLMYGKNRVQNILDNFQLVRDIPIHGSF